MIPLKSVSKHVKIQFKLQSINFLMFSLCFFFFTPSCFIWCCYLFWEKNVCFTHEKLSTWLNPQSFKLMTPWTFWWIFGGIIENLSIFTRQLYSYIHLNYLVFLWIFFAVWHTRWCKWFFKCEWKVLVFSFSS